MHATKALYKVPSESAAKNYPQASVEYSGMRE